MNRDIYKLTLAMIPDIGVSAVKRLLGFFNNEEEICLSSKEKINKLEILTTKQKDALLTGINNYPPDKVLELLSKTNMKVTCYGDEDYPKRLYDITNPPYQLFYYGSLPNNNMPSVSIIGARNCSEYGREVAKYYGNNLGKLNIQIISGLASGIDGISQQTCVASGGISFAVLGSGADICYPSSNRKLYESLKEKGGILSEYPPGTRPINNHFPMRNRIISGLSDVVLVVEAREKSGTAITVNLALEQGKAVFAVPGRISDPLSIGCNKMIYEGAGIARTVDDILNELGIHKGNICKNASISIKNEMERTIYDLLEYKEYTADMLLNMLDMQEIESLYLILFEMEERGLIVERSGRYKRKTNI